MNHGHYAFRAIDEAFDAAEDRRAEARAARAAADPDADLFVDLARASEYGPHQFVVDASDLGWRAGEWPRRFATNLGNGQPFLAHARIDAGGEFGGVEYRQHLGCLSLRVYND